MIMIINISFIKYHTDVVSFHQIVRADGEGYLEGVIIVVETVEYLES